ERQSHLQSWWCTEGRTDRTCALARRAGPSRCRVVRFALRAASHPFITLRRDSLRAALRVKGAGRRFRQNIIDDWADSRTYNQHQLITQSVVLSSQSLT